VMPWGCYIVLSFRNSLLSTTMLTLLIVAIVWDILTSLFLAKPIKCFIVNFRKIKEIENKKPLNNKQKEKIISLYKEISNQLTLIS
jgi:preprotein translocase subunit SecF